MKKLIALAFIGGLVIIGCSKKPEHPLQDSNVMLPEPEVKTTDSVAVVKTDSVMPASDSTAVSTK